MTTTPEPADTVPVPAAFLPPPKRRRKTFTDEPMFEPPAGGERRKERISRLAAEAEADNPKVAGPVPWDWTAKARRARRRQRR